MKELSSKTENLRVKFLSIVFVIIALFFGYFAITQKDYTLLIPMTISLLMAIYQYKTFVRDCATSVLDSGETLLIKKSDTEFRVNIADITGVTFKGYRKNQRVIIRFSKSTPLGSFVHFIPKRPLIKSKHEDIQDLIDRVRKARLNALGLPDGEV